MNRIEAVKESISFERGKNPRKTLRVGKYNLSYEGQAANLVEDLEAIGVKAYFEESFDIDGVIDVGIDGIAGLDEEDWPEGLRAVQISAISGKAAEENDWEEGWAIFDENKDPGDLTYSGEQGLEYRDVYIYIVKELYGDKNEIQKKINDLSRQIEKLTEIMKEL